MQTEWVLNQSLVVYQSVTLYTQVATTPLVAGLALTLLIARQPLFASSLIPRLLPPPVFDSLRYANIQGKVWENWSHVTPPPVCLPSVNLMSSHVTRSPRPSPSMFYILQIQCTGGRNGLGTRLVASASLYPGLVQRLFMYCRQLAYVFLQLTHSCANHAVHVKQVMMDRGKKVWLEWLWHINVIHVVIVAEFSWAFLLQLYCQQSQKGCLSNGIWQENVSARSSTTKVSFCTKIIYLCQCTTVIMIV